MKIEDLELDGSAAVTETLLSLLLLKNVEKSRAVAEVDPRRERRVIGLSVNRDLVPYSPGGGAPSVLITGRIEVTARLEPTTDEVDLVIGGLG